MNFFSIFGPNIYSNERETTTTPNQVNPSDVVSNIFSTEIQELLQPILSESINNNRAPNQTQTTDTQTTDDTRTEEIFYFENMNQPSPQLSLSELNEATTLEIKSEEEEEKEEMVCVICHNVIEPKTIYRKINNCQHCFHVKCIDEWLNENSTCPTCRIELSGRRQQSSNTSSRVRRNGTTSFSFPLYSFRYT